jgi:hypothetical protein
MAWPKAGPGRPKDDTKTALAKKAARQAALRVQKQSLRAALRNDAYIAKYVPLEVVQRALDGVPLPDGKKITDYHLERANELLPYTTPKLLAQQVQIVPPPTPRIEEILRGSSLEALEMLRDALALCLDEAGRQIDGSAVAIEEDAA